ncbi:hypothetical protein LP420_06245 [Massilia sp. B-10]|nr:hypothetical protein LP420_06245 [Massilia sp. B-10]
MLRVFSEYIHNEMLPYSGVVERFIGDGALIRFHYVGFDAHQLTTNPVVALSTRPNVSCNRSIVSRNRSGVT